MGLEMRWGCARMLCCLTGEDWRGGGHEDCLPIVWRSRTALGLRVAVWALSSGGARHWQQDREGVGEGAGGHQDGRNVVAISRESLHRCGERF